MNCADISKNRYELYNISAGIIIKSSEVQDVWLYTDYRTWAKLDTGGWVRLESITDTTDNSNNATNENSNVSNDIIETEAPAEETTTNDPIQLEGVYIPNGSGRSVYGCGNKHTSTVDGIVFIWYDRYESRNDDNTRVYYSLNIISLDVEHTIEESGLYAGQKNWLLNYELQTSDDISINLYWNIYDKEDYLIGDIHSRSLDYDFYIKVNRNNKAKGVWQLGGRSDYPAIEKASYVELCPYF